MLSQASGTAEKIIRDEDAREMTRIQAAIAPKLLAQVIEEFCARAGADKDVWFAEFSSRYLTPVAGCEDAGRYADLCRQAAECLVQDTHRAMHPNIRPCRPAGLSGWPPQDSEGPCVPEL
jgi:hypothetical protein